MTANCPKAQLYSRVFTNIFEVGESFGKTSGESFAEWLRSLEFIFDSMLDFEQGTTEAKRVQQSSMFRISKIMQYRWCSLVMRFSRCNFQSPKATDLYKLAFAFPFEIQKSR